MKAVGEVKEERDCDRRNDQCQGQGHAQDSLTAICSTVFATDSSASVACSTESTMSLSLRTSSDSYSPLKRFATIRRYERSPWFSSRLISIQYSSKIGRASCRERG